MKRTPMKRRNVKRSKKRYQEHFGDKAAFVRSHACCVCDRPGPSDPHHHPSRGAGGTSADLVPLCRAHHNEFHRRGAETFQAEHGVDLKRVAATMETWFRNSPQDLGF